MKHPEIPRDWTAEQAMAVVDWLQTLLDALWDLYGNELADHLAQRAAPSPDVERQAELPF
jgi:hypothetical protein